MSDFKATSNALSGVRFGGIEQMFDSIEMRPARGARSSSEGVGVDPRIVRFEITDCETPATSTPS